MDNTETIIYKTTEVKIQLCPKCYGDGNLQRYNSPPIISTSTSIICDVCNGSKTIPYHSETVFSDCKLIPVSKIEELIKEMEAKKELSEPIKVKAGNATFVSNTIDQD